MLNSNDPDPPNILSVMNSLDEHIELTSEFENNNQLSFFVFQENTFHTTVYHKPFSFFTPPPPLHQSYQKLAGLCSTNLTFVL